MPRFAGNLAPCETSAKPVLEFTCNRLGGPRHSFLDMVDLYLPFAGALSWLAVRLVATGFSRSLRTVA